MSLFGSLGLARAGLKTFIASFSIPAWNIVGAQTLSNMGFKPQGMNLSLIMVDPSDKDGRYLVEIRLDKLVEELHIDKAKIQDIRHKSTEWNVRMMVLSAILCMLSVVPYIFLNVKTGNGLPHHTRWKFPVLRATGGFLTTAMMQFIMQRRIATLARRWILEHCLDKIAAKESGKSTGGRTGDIEKNPRTRGAPVNVLQATIAEQTAVTDSNSPLTWLLLVLLLLGVLASIVGYVGCFSVVQSADRSSGPLSWLCLEAGLSLLRMFLWGWNPTGDDAPPLQLVLGRDRYPPLPTCKLYDHDIETDKLLPLTRANQFLNSITSFTGVVERFDHPDVTLYYTLTRNAIAHADSHNATLHKPGEHALYITIFDHKERVNTRVYTQRSGADFFYVTESSLPVIDPKQGLLEIKLGDEIDNQDDPITSDVDIRSKLHTHYRSIMDQMHFAIGQSEREPTYTIENKWTMAMVHTTSTPRSGEGQTTETNTDARTSVMRDFYYLQHGRLEKICRSLCLARGEWIATYMHWGVREMRERFMSQASTSIGSDVDRAPLGRAKAEGKRRILADELEWESPLQVRSDQGDTESRVIDQIQRMELLLVKEMEIWEEHLWDRANTFIGRDDVLEKARLTKEWKRGFRTRLDTGIRAMEARLDAAELEVKASRSDESKRKWRSTHKEIRKAWQALAEKPTPSFPPMHPSHLKHLHTEYQKSARDVEAIIRWSQLTAAQSERLAQQSATMSQSIIELKEAVFWMDDTSGLIEYRLSRSKWLNLHMRHVTRPFEVYTHALRAMSDVIFVRFDGVDSDKDYARVAESIRNLPSVTSICVPHSRQLPAIQRDTPLFIDNNGSNKIETFLRDNQSQLARTRRTHVFIDTGDYYPCIYPARLEIRRGSKIAVSFFGPSSGNLILKLTHSSLSRNDSVTLILEESHGPTSIFRYPVPSSLTVTTITLFPSSSDRPSFVPNTRNNLIIHVALGSSLDYMVQDIRLHDEAGNDYNPASPEA
jgi:hypothetical protein